MNALTDLSNIPIDFAVIKSMYADYKSVHSKISELEKSGKIIRLKKGLYVVSPKESGKLLSLELIANHIYGPSYISEESALRYFGLIPESVFIVRSMTTKHSKVFENALGKFEYTQCATEYFAIGIRQEMKENVSFLIATPEKALCDLILNTPNLNLRYQKELISYLEEDIRLDIDVFYKMDATIFEQCLKYGKKKTTISNLIKLLKR